MLLETENLSKSYIVKEFLGEKKFAALKNISFFVKEGESLSIIGSSGSGKTTLGKIAAGILNYDAGKLKYYGKEIKDYSVKELSSIVQMIFQNPYASLNPKLTIRTSLFEAVAEKSVEEAEFAAKEALETVGLEGKIMDNYPHQFSGGQRQRIAVARVLLKNPKFIIADEPFASLDIYSQNRLLDVFKNIKEKLNTSIMLITHDISAAAHFADRMIIMKDGEIIRDSSFENIYNEKENTYITELISSMEL